MVRPLALGRCSLVHIFGEDVMMKPLKRRDFFGDAGGADGGCIPRRSVKSHTPRQSLPRNRNDVTTPLTTEPDPRAASPDTILFRSGLYQPGKHAIKYVNVRSDEQWNLVYPHLLLNLKKHLLNSQSCPPSLRRQSRVLLFLSSRYYRRPVISSCFFLQF